MPANCMTIFFAKPRTHIGHANHLSITLNYSGEVEAARQELEALLGESLQDPLARGCRALIDGQSGLVSGRPGVGREVTMLKPDNVSPPMR